MFTAPFTSAFIVFSHDSQTYKPRSTRLLSRICPQHEHVLRKIRGESLALQGGDEADQQYATDDDSIDGFQRNH
jgi:hypothetical protein